MNVHPGTPDRMTVMHSIPDLADALSTPDRYEVSFNWLGWTLRFEEGGMELVISEQDAHRVIDAIKAWKTASESEADKA